MPTSKQTAEEIFEAAQKLPSWDAKIAYLDDACAGDPALHERLEGLLRAPELPTNFFPRNTEGHEEAVFITEKPGDRIGRYKLLQKIGEGGCGVVYMAEQEEPVRRRVALKVIKLGMDTKSVIARFEAERQALALMDHPNIAKVLDAGATETGRPYFVMELVRGVRITDYCDQNNLSTRPRLDLFTQVCHAIQHAHQKGIIHRDIKPSNILVTMHDGVPVPKVIDFGIAKATTDQRLTDKTLFTALEQFIGTPAYMSPEQAEMSGLDIDTRSDIYALGVLLYELLTGRTPFDAKRLLKSGLDEIRRIIREEEPPRPSTRLSTLGQADLAEIAKHHHSEPAKLTSLIRGDLDWIVMKCLEKDRTRRYETANGVAADVQRHLNNRSVEAMPPSIVYQARKFLKRRRQYVAVGILIVALMLAVIVIGLVQVRAEAFREAAHLAAQRQEESDVLSKIIGKIQVTDSEATRSKECVARIANRVCAGNGSSLDLELLARILCLNVEIKGHRLQRFAEPSVYLHIGSGPPGGAGIGAILSPVATLEPSGVRISLKTAYLTFGSERAASAITLEVPLEGRIAAPGLLRVACALTIQIVKPKGPELVERLDTTVGYEAIGVPMHLVLPLFRCTLVEELPPQVPVELTDGKKPEQIRAGFSVSEAMLSTDAQNRLRLNLQMVLAPSAIGFPLALRIDVQSLDDRPVDLFHSQLVVDEENAYHAQGDEGGSVYLRGNEATVKTSALLPDAWGYQAGRTPRRGVISIRSSKEIARGSGLQQFLSITGFNKEFEIKQLNRK